jgi:ABC-type oligopeptide transport system substrate-binding subunit
VNPDPALTRSTEGVWVDTLLYSGLLKFDQNMHVVPDLAVALPTPSTNGKTYEFTLRSDARFADGNPVTSRDVAASLTRALSRAEGSVAAWNALGGILGARAVRQGTASTLAGVQVVRRHGLIIRLKKSDYSFLARLALPAASILDISVVSSTRDWWRHGAGTGPFQFGATQKQINLIANPHYYGGAMKVATLRLLRVASMSEQYALYKHHRLDATSVPPSRYASASSRPGFSSADTGQAYYVDASGLGSRTERVALDQALDRSLLSRPASSLDALSTIVPPVVPDYPASSDPNQFDLSSAQAVLAQSPAIPVKMPDGMAAGSLAAWLKGSWSAPGRAVRFTPNGTVRVFSMAQVLPDPTPWLTVAGRSLVNRAAQTTFQTMLADANGIEGSDNVLNQYAAYNRAEDYLLRNALIIPLGVQKQGYLISPMVSGLGATPIGLEPQNQNWSSVAVG